MKPVYKLEADGVDITKKISERFVSLSYSDNSGFHNDRITVVLDDREPHVSLAKLSTNLKVWIGYEKTEAYEKNYRMGLVYIGSFYVDEIAVSKDPARTISIVARANDTGGTMKTTKTRSWTHTTLGELARQIATEHSLTARIHPSLASLTIHHLDQSSQSDQGLLTMLANKNNAVFKIVDDLLYLSPRGADTTVRGDVIPTITIAEKELTSYSVTIQQRSNHSTVTTRHYDVDEAKEKVQSVESESSNESETETQVEEIAPTEDEAFSSAQAKSGELNREKETLNFSMLGLPSVRAETKVRITEFRPELRDTWLIKTATHSIGRGGYTVSVNCETAGE